MSPRAQFLIQEHKQIWLVFLDSLTLLVAWCYQWCSMFSYLAVELFPKLCVFNSVWKNLDTWFLFNVYQWKVCLKFVVKYLSHELQTAGKNERVTVLRTQRPVFSFWPLPDLIYRDGHCVHFSVIKFSICKMGVIAFFLYSQMINIIIKHSNWLYSLLQRLRLSRNGSSGGWGKST